MKSDVLKNLEVFMAYWQRDAYGVFVYEIESLEKKFGVKGSVLSVVEKGCRVIKDNFKQELYGKCLKCGNLIADFYKLRPHLIGLRKSICPKCEEWFKYVLEEVLYQYYKTIDHTKYKLSKDLTTKEKEEMLKITKGLKCLPNGTPSIEILEDCLSLTIH